jgi:CheY-like chemotaxis protein
VTYLEPSAAGSAPAGDATLASDGARSPRRMTVIDDSEEFVELLRDIFRDRYEVAVPRAVSLGAIAETQPDLLVVDLHTQANDGLDGWQLVRDARADGVLASVPIVVCSADQAALMDGHDRLDTELGVHLVIKPFELDDLEDVVDGAVRSSGPDGG